MNFSKTLKAVTVLSLSVVASAAAAQETATNWTGAYVGAFTEGALNQFSMNDKDYWYDNERVFVSETSADFGLKAGYDWQAGPLVYGVSASYSGGPSIKKDVWTDDAFYQSEVKNTAAVRGRIGIAADKNLFYVTGAILSGEFSGIVSEDRNGQGANPIHTATDNERRMGASLGMGFSRILTDNLALELEGEFQAFKTGYSDMYVIESDTYESNYEIGFGLSRTVLRAGLNYRF